MSAIVILMIACGAVFVALYKDEPAVKQSAVESRPAAPPVYLQPKAKTPRLASMDPSLFQDAEIRAAYQVAVDAPELLEKLPCYCGCFTTGHTSNYDCFVDNHGQT